MPITASVLAQVRHPQRRAGRQHDDERRGQPDREPQRGQLDRRDLRRDQPAEHRAARPQHRRAEREQRDGRPVDAEIASGFGKASSQAPTSAGTANQANDGPEPLAQQDRRAEDRDDRLELLDHRRGHRVAVPERHGEQRGGHRGRADADQRPPRPGRARRAGGTPGRARGRNGSSTSTRIACSAKTMVGAATSRASGSRRSASVPHRAAASATTQVRSRARAAAGRSSRDRQRDQPSRHSRSSASLRSSRSRMISSALAASSAVGNGPSRSLALLWPSRSTCPVVRL